MDENIELTLNANEANALIKLIDLATKAAGLQVAEAAVHLTKKLQEAGASHCKKKRLKKVRVKAEKPKT